VAVAERRGGVLATRVAYTPLQHAQKEEGHLEVLIEARNRAGRWCREFGGEDRWRVKGGARGRFAAKVEVDGSGLGEVPGVEAEPMRCLAGAPVQRSGGITAA